MYIHCYAHCLNLPLVIFIFKKPNLTPGLKNIRCIFNFFRTLQFIYSLIEGSSIRHVILENIITSFDHKYKTLKSRWVCWVETVNSVKINYCTILKIVE